MLGSGHCAVKDSKSTIPGPVQLPRLKPGKLPGAGTRPEEAREPPKGQEPPSPHDPSGTRQKQNRPLTWRGQRATRPRTLSPDGEGLPGSSHTTDQESVSSAPRPPSRKGNHGGQGSGVDAGGSSRRPGLPAWLLPEA